MKEEQDIKSLLLVDNLLSKLKFFNVGKSSWQQLY